jgi:hypothetical protein
VRLLSELVQFAAVVAIPLTSGYLLRRRRHKRQPHQE